MNPVQHILITAVRLYRWTLSPAQTFFFGPAGRCRFEPTCSHYAMDAIRMHGALTGCGLAARRLLRCHPWGGCGHDPVPAPHVRASGCAANTVGHVPPVVGAASQLSE